MENTGQVLFQDDTPRWFVALGKETQGPLSASDLYEKVLMHEITWAHYVWRKGLAAWTRLCDIDEFKSAVPGAPSSAPPVGAAASRAAKVSKAQSAPPAPRGEPERDWYLYYNDGQFGPFTEAEVERLLRSGRINTRVHAWTAGMDAWSRIAKVPTFRAWIEEIEARSGSGAEEKSQQPGVVREQRRSPRAPMTARLLMSDDREVFDALCRDVSTGGMQVLTKMIPGKVGARIKLNITPGVREGEKLRKNAPLRPFVAEGVIVRLLEDGRGFSFRFERLSPEARKSIEEYVKEESHGA